MELKRDAILEDFMSDKTNKEFYEAYITEPTIKNKNLLDKQFKKHFYIVRCITYFVKMIHFESRHFDKKQRERNQKFQLSLDKVSENGKLMIDLIPDKYSSIEPFFNSLEDAIANPSLFRAVLGLTYKQKNLLYLLFVQNMLEAEAAAVLGVSQQTINKTKKNALNKLRKEICLIG